MNAGTRTPPGTCLLGDGDEPLGAASQKRRGAPKPAGYEEQSDNESTGGDIRRRRSDTAWAMKRHDATHGMKLGSAAPNGVPAVADTTSQVEPLRSGRTSAAGFGSEYHLKQLATPRAERQSGRCSRTKRRRDPKAAPIGAARFAALHSGSSRVGPGGFGPPRPGAAGALMSLSHPVTLDARNAHGQRVENPAAPGKLRRRAQKSFPIIMIQIGRKIPWTKACTLSFTVGWWKESERVLGQLETDLPLSRR
jgi:hypothetical protein